MEAVSYIAEAAMLPTCQNCTYCHTANSNLPKLHRLQYYRLQKHASQPGGPQGGRRIYIYIYIYILSCKKTLTAFLFLFLLFFYLFFWSFFCHFSAPLFYRFFVRFFIVCFTVCVSWGRTGARRRLAEPASGHRFPNVFFAVAGQ